MLSAKQTAQFRHLLESRIAELGRLISAAQQETRAYAARHADPADQTASEYERQAAVHKADAARQKLKVLTEALLRLDQGTYGERQSRGQDTAWPARERGSKDEMRYVQTANSNMGS